MAEFAGKNKRPVAYFSLGLKELEVMNEAFSTNEMMQANSNQ